MSVTERSKETRGGPGMRGLARFSAIITILPASMGAGWIIGYFLVDRAFHTFPWGSILITLFGAGAGFYEIVKILIPNRDQDGGTDGRA